MGLPRQLSSAINQYHVQIGLTHPRDGKFNTSTVDNAEIIIICSATDTVMPLQSKPT